MWKKNLLTTTAMAIAVSGCMLVPSGCHKSQLSPVSPKSSAELAMKSFAMVISELEPEERKKLTSIQQLYKHANGPADWSEFRSASWSHAAWETTGRPRFDYVMHPNSAGIPDEEAILIATPCEIRIKDGEFARVALTHALNVIHINDREFHQRVYDQSE